MFPKSDYLPLRFILPRKVSIYVFCISVYSLKSLTFPGTVHQQSDSLFCSLLKLYFKDTGLFIFPLPSLVLLFLFSLSADLLPLFTLLYSLHRFHLLAALAHSLFAHILSYFRLLSPYIFPIGSLVALISIIFALNYLSL